MKLSPKERAALLRLDFNTFNEQAFYHLNPGAKFLPAAYQRLIGGMLEKCRQGKITRLIINVPPRSLKSHSVSVALPAFWLGHHPNAQIINVTYGQDLSDKFSRDCRALMQADWYREIFPGTVLSPHRQAVHEFETTAHGFRKATSVGGVLTGRGADLIILDDVLKPDQALSDAERKTVNDWHYNTLLSRLNDKTAGVIIVVMQRLHQDDLVGRLIEEGGWEVLALPAIAESDECYEFETPFGVERFIRRCGEALHPERESLELLESIKRQIGEYNFAAQYQQSPVPLGGGLVKREWLQFYEPRDLPESFDQLLQSWDTANKPSEFSDWCVCTTWGIKGKNIYLLHVLRERLAYPSLKRAVREQAEHWHATVVIIEDKASGTQLIQDFADEGFYPVQGYKPEGDKIMRMDAQTGVIAAGLVFLPKRAPWLDCYLLELTTFPSTRYRDQCDSTSMALDWVKRSMHFTAAGWMEYYKQLALGTVQPAAPSGIRLQAPSGISHAHTLSGKSVAVGPDGTAEFSEEDAGPLLGAGWKRAA